MDERAFAAATFKVLGRFFSEKVKKVWYLLVCLSLLCICRGKTTKQMLLVRDKFRFLYAGILFDVTKCKFIVKNSSLKCWLFSPIFVVNTNNFHV